MDCLLSFAAAKADWGGRTVEGAAEKADARGLAVTLLLEILFVPSELKEA
jgi:hypothetical protein